MLTKIVGKKPSWCWLAYILEHLLIDCYRKPILNTFADVRKDIHIPKVEGVSMAVVKETEGTEAEWGVYLINSKQVELKNVIVSSKGYGNLNDEEVKTSTLRHFFDEVKANSHQKIEKIMPDVFGLNNEYMLTFYIDGVIHDRKYIFVPDSVVEENLILIPLIDRPGVLIK